MRMKFKPWAREELETSPFYIDNPCDYKGKWKTAFEKEYSQHAFFRQSVIFTLRCGQCGNY